MDNQPVSDIAVYNLQADLCRSMSQPARITIIHILFDGPHNGNEIVRLSGMTESNMSRHLEALKQVGMVNAEWHGREFLYNISNLKIIEICNLMQVVLMEQIKHKLQLLSES